MKCKKPAAVNRCVTFFFSSACQMDIHGKIREVLAETVRDDHGSACRSLSEADFLRALQRRGIIDDVMKDLHFTQVADLFKNVVHFLAS